MKKKTKLALFAATSIAIGSIVPTLIGGKPAPKDKYPSTVRIFSGGGSCTATLIGPKVLLTAAHCVDDGGSVRFDYKGSSVNSKACKHHDGYSDNTTKDFALCEVPALTGKWETINTNHKLVSKGDKVTLTGYGCTEPGGEGGNDGILREGGATVTGVPSRNSFDIVTRASAGALCYGDSGGPAFVENGTSRVLIGVNSRGNIKDTSYLSAVHMADQGFMKKWADERGLKICGIQKLDDCNSVPNKPDEPDGFLNGFSVEKLLEILQTIFDLLADFFDDKSK